VLFCIINLCESDSVPGGNSEGDPGIAIKMEIICLKSVFYLNNRHIHCYKARTEVEIIIS
jgi:hypothetical protein